MNISDLILDLNDAQCRLSKEGLARLEVQEEINRSNEISYLRLNNNNENN